MLIKVSVLCYQYALYTVQTVAELGIIKTYKTAFQHHLTYIAIYRECYITVMCLILAQIIYNHLQSLVNRVWDY